MNFVERLIEGLRNAGTDPHAQAVVTAEFLLQSQPETARLTLRAVLDAAACLRWFDAKLLARVLGLEDRKAQEAFESLKALPFVERFRRDEKDVRNVHEATRLGWRKKLSQEENPTFRNLSQRAARCFEDDLTPAGRIEWIYHLLCQYPEEGANELEKLDRNWNDTARHDERYALAAALK